MCRLITFVGKYVRNERKFYFTLQKEAKYFTGAPLCCFFHSYFQKPRRQDGTHCSLDKLTHAGLATMPLQCIGGWERPKNEQFPRESNNSASKSILPVRYYVCNSQKSIDQMPTSTNWTRLGISYYFWEGG